MWHISGAWHTENIWSRLVLTIVCIIRYNQVKCFVYILIPKEQLPQRGICEAYASLLASSQAL